MSHLLLSLPTTSCQRGVFPMFLLENLRDFVFGPREFKILFTGLEGAGTSAVIHLLQTPNIFQGGIQEREYERNFKIIRYKRCKIRAVHNESRLRYCGKFGMDAIVFVVDSSRRDKFKEAKRELERILAIPEFKESKLLILNHKIDKPEYVSSVILIQEFGLMHLLNREWCVESTTCRDMHMKVALDRLYLSLMGKLSMFETRETPVVVVASSQ